MVTSVKFMMANSEQIINNKESTENQHLVNIRNRSSSSSSLDSSSESSLSNSISLIKLEEIEKLEAYAKMEATSTETSTKIMEQEPEKILSLPVKTTEPQASSDHRRASLPIEEKSKSTSEENIKDKENQPIEGEDLIENSFQLVDMECANEAPVVGPSLPPARDLGKNHSILSDTNQSSMQPASSHLGESLIEMVIQLRTENQNLLDSLQKNNNFVKERIEEFQRASEESKSRESQFALERAEYEHQIRKLQRMNSVLSERLKIMETKLKDMKLEVTDSLAAANPSKADSRNEEFDPCLYPNLSDLEPFPSNGANNSIRDSRNGCNNNDETSSVQMDVGNDELNNEPTEPSAPILDNNLEKRASAYANLSDIDVSKMTKEELSKHFDSNKAAFYAMDDPMKQCDKLEKQLNDIGRRDYEICILQQQLNIYRQDYRLERMANLEAKIQIEKLKNDIDKLCFERLQDKCARDEPENCRRGHSTGVKFVPGSHTIIGKMGRKAAKSAAKAAKYAAKQAHLEEKAAAAAAKVAARYNARQEAHNNQASADNGRSHSSAHTTGDEFRESSSHQGHHRRGSQHHRGSHSHKSGIKSEVVNDLWETANKAMLTGYKMASTHVNLALDKLSEFEQSQASHLSKNKYAPSAPKASFAEPDLD